MFDFNILQQGNGEHRWPSGHYDVGGWDQVRAERVIEVLECLLNVLVSLQGLRHGELTYFRPDGSREEATYVEGYEQGPSTVHFARLEIIPESVFL